MRSGGQRARASAMEPQHVRPVLGAQSPAWEEPVGTAPAPTPPACPCSLPPPPGPGSVQEAVRDEVPSCFPAGAALPPAPGLLLARRRERLCPVGRSSSPRGLWRRSFEDHFRASSFSQLCTSFPSVLRRPRESRRRGCAVSGWRRRGAGAHLLTAPWQSPGRAGSRGPPPGEAGGCQKPRATPPTRVAAAAPNCSQGQRTWPEIQPPANFAFAWISRHTPRGDRVILGAQSVAC